MSNPFYNIRALKPTVATNCSVPRHHFTIVLWCHVNSLGLAFAVSWRQASGQVRLWCLRFTFSFVPSNAKALAVLAPRETEDFLCVYKAHLRPGMRRATG